MSISIGDRPLDACDGDLLTALRGFGVADLHESLPPATRMGSLMSHSMRPIVPGSHVVGRAMTAATAPGDNLVLYAALERISPGQVLVMSNGGVAHGALFGDVSASFALKMGVAGVVVDGPVRDVSSLRDMRCPVWSTVVSPSHPEKRGPGSVNEPIVCAGCLVRPGDVIVADDDAVLVIRPGDLPAVIEAAEERRNREIGYRERIAGGEHICDILGMREVVASLVNASTDRGGVS
ncbi:4-carboxy-4-hydroxy-2-oxoadipate aldolase/oxaloacetate decarboxylase [Sphingomonas corticis]|uniref:4-carboxy-4-hydroxy-2-oxoadipate aldolase/oxaloacetate decarboxylase n=1 Tax=Sphingomonas corticis TaxID=2722791 RepID=A0ABX1CWD4_9SPHN|nr:4-carboxy-4-hydroxy-2-oxoadipate aldolase/oxaloacetate decarboxylase [Sphingomonas corticis]NJR80590.1 4-carboxy-4-hydroxy-2-oxoadipate aldolase/oxaloacetate decarboxylase [Sphingomonas corticis]